jgi:hypothetical protein
MKLIYAHLAASAAVAVLGSITLAACDADTANEQPNTGINEKSDDADTLTLRGDNRVAHAVKQSPSLIHVDIDDQLGVRQFSVEYEVGGTNDEAIRWTLFKPSEGLESLETASGSLPSGLSELPTLSDSIAASVYIQSQVSASIQEQEYDNYGCDIPNWAVDSCGSKGQCCDVHDACYAEHDCTAASWFYLWGDCRGCNSAVVACILNDNPGPSSCCAANNCGQPR